MSNLPHIARFVNLHLTTLQKHSDHATRESVTIYRVEGKVRPMLVLSQSDRDRGQHWSNVLAITSKGTDSRGRPRTDLLPIGNCIHEDRQSFVETRLQRLPDNMIARKPGEPYLVQPCNPLEFANVIKVIQQKILGNRNFASD